MIYVFLVVKQHIINWMLPWIGFEVPDTAKSVEQGTEQGRISVENPTFFCKKHMLYI